MDDCVFCKIVKGEIPSTKVYEDEKILIFFDINPVNPGHLLVIPKEHHEMMIDTPDELVSHAFVQSKKFMNVLKKTLKPDYVALSVVGVDVPHFHIHLIPRYFDDGMANFWPTKKYEDGEAEEIAKKIRENLE